MASMPAIVPDWRAFAQAVAALLQALDPVATVRHNHYTDDLDTGRKRQRDVWIETRQLGGLFILKMLVSCKRKTARLSQQDVDAFAGELRASGAHKGLLFSHSGFTGPALVKARKLDISCCGLFENRPADLPKALLYSTYLYRQRIAFDVRGATYSEVAPVLGAPNGPDGQTMLSSLVAHHETNRPTHDEVLGGTPPTWASEITIPIDGDDPVTLRVASGWEIYRARREACLLNGVYSFTNEVFAGGMSTPSVRAADPIAGVGVVEAGRQGRRRGLRARDGGQRGRRHKAQGPCPPHRHLYRPIID